MSLLCSICHVNPNLDSLYPNPDISLIIMKMADWSVGSMLFFYQSIEEKN